MPCVPELDDLTVGGSLECTVGVDQMVCLDFSQLKAMMAAVSDRQIR